MKRATGKGAAAFGAHYRGLYGDRWDGLARALEGAGASLPFRAAPDAEPYFLDAASVLAAEALELPAEGEVLDACAAPGGKCLVLASRLPPGARLLANELSPDRRRRLALVLDRHLPARLRARVTVSGADAAAMCRRNEGRFGAILLDAPCSSERHVLADATALAAWSPSRPRSLAGRQWALLSAAFIMLAPGGCLVYATCALDPAENDGVVARLLGKRGADLALAPPATLLAAGGEATLHGVALMPDRVGGAGPMYVARIRKAPGIAASPARP